MESISIISRPKYFYSVYKTIRISSACDHEITWHCHIDLFQFIILILILQGYYAIYEFLIRKKNYSGYIWFPLETLNFGEFHLKRIFN